jgi:hypothetical protein
MPGARFAWSGVAVDLVFAVALAAFRHGNASAGQRHAEGMLPSVALGVICAAPGVIAAIGVRLRCPTLVAAAGIACAPILILSIATFPIVLPASLFAVAFAQATGWAPPARARVVLAGALFVALSVVAMVVWLRDWGHYDYVFAGGSESGDYVLPAHAVVAMVIAGANVVLTTLAAR